jgi:hypothetical protein
MSTLASDLKCATEGLLEERKAKDQVVKEMKLQQESEEDRWNLKLQSLNQQRFKTFVRHQEHEGKAKISATDAEHLTVDDLEDEFFQTFNKKSKLSVMQAKQFILRIAEKKLAFCYMRKEMCRSLQHLGPDLYPSALHVISELIQNADDCDFGVVRPRILILYSQTSKGCFLIFASTETGFRTHDVLSICSLGRSTKTQGSHIGQKGIGFKSIFGFCNAPTILSKPWFFGFEPGFDEVDSYLTPRWRELKNIRQLPRAVHDTARSHRTVFFLPLNAKLKLAKSLAPEKGDNPFLDELSLLFLKQIRTIEIRDEVETHTAFTFDSEKISDLDYTLPVTQGLNLLGPPSFSIFRISSFGNSHVMLVQAEIRRHNSSPQSGSTCVKLCFPCSNSLSFCDKYSVFAFLPVCKLGFPFALHADWILTTDRSAVHEMNELNIYIRDQCALLAAACLLFVSPIKEQVLGCSNVFIPGRTSSCWWNRFVDTVHQILSESLYETLTSGNGKRLAYCEDSSDLHEIFHANDLSRFAGFHLLSNEEYHRFKGIILSTSAIHPVASLKFEKLSIFHVLECFPSSEGSLNDSFNPEETATLDLDTFQHWDKLFSTLMVSSAEAHSRALKKPIFSLRQRNMHSCRGFLTDIAKAYIFDEKDMCPHLKNVLLKGKLDIQLVNQGKSSAESRFLEMVIRNGLVNNSVALEAILKHFLSLRFRQPEQGEISSLVHELFFIKKFQDTAFDCLARISGQVKCSFTDLQQILCLPVLDPRYSICFLTKTCVYLPSILLISCARNITVFENKCYVAASLPADCNSEELGYTAVEWERVLIWAGCKLPPGIRNLRESEKQDFQPLLLHWNNAFSALVLEHEQSALHWFRAQLRSDVYYDQRISEISEYAAITEDLKSMCSVCIPPSMDNLSAVKLGIIPLEGKEQLLVYRLEHMGCCLESWRQYQWESLFKLLNNASVKVANLAATKPIFSILNEGGNSPKRGQIGSCAVEHIYEVQFEDDGVDGIVSKESSDLIYFLKGALRSVPPLVTLIGYCSKEEKEFLHRDIFHPKQKIQHLDVMAAIKIILSRHAELNESKSQLYDHDQLLCLKDELIFLFQNNARATEYCAQHYNQFCAIDEAQCLLNYLHRPLQVCSLRDQENMWFEVLVWLQMRPCKEFFCLNTDQYEHQPAVVQNMLLDEDDPDWSGPKSSQSKESFDGQSLIFL